MCVCVFLLLCFRSIVTSSPSGSFSPPPRGVPWTCCSATLRVGIRRGWTLKRPPVSLLIPSAEQWRFQVLVNMHSIHSLHCVLCNNFSILSLSAYTCISAGAPSSRSIAASASSSMAAAAAMDVDNPGITREMYLMAACAVHT